VSSFAAGEHVGTATGANSIPFFVPSSPEAYTYDDDGNLTSDGRCIYTYDGENRLMTVELKSSLAGLSPIAFEGKWYYEYDYLGRRIRKYRKSGIIEEMMMSNMGEGGETNSGGGEEGGEILDETKFMYDGWLLTLELTGNSVQRSYVWGLDLSGSMQGAGGIGGLLFQQNSGGTPTTSNMKWFSQDPQGNVTNLRNLNDDDRWAAIEYGPFGERLTGAGNLDQFKMRYSGKYFDEETGFSYFGYRYYNSSTGRWTNRDPAEDGLNHYAAVLNSPTSFVDSLGLWVRKSKWSSENAYVVAECGDTWDSLSNLLLGTSLPTELQQQFNQKPSAGVQYDAKTIIETFESRLREQVVRRTRSFRPAHISAAQASSPPGIATWMINQIDSFFIPGSTSQTDCTWSTKVILAKAVDDMLKPAEFDQMFSDSQNGSAIGLFKYLEVRTVPFAQALPGDIMRYDNDGGVAHADPGSLWRAENVIKTQSAPARYFAPGVGSGLTEAEIRSALIRNAPASIQSPQPQGWAEEGFKFFNVPKLSSRIFDFRRNGK